MALIILQEHLSKTNILMEKGYIPTRIYDKYVVTMLDALLAIEL